MTWSGYSEKGVGSQERGPGSFALDVPGVPRAEAGYRAQGVQMRAPQVSAGPSNSIGIPSGKPDPTLQALLKLGSEALQKDIERKHEQAFVEGMVKAASGQALTEIVNEQPWYSRIFGPSGIVEGARAYSATAAVSRWVVEQQNNMQELRRQGPDAIPSYLMGTMDSFMTGDSQTDTMIRAEFIKQVPMLIKEHTKQHYAYLQETAREARVGAFHAVADKVQAAYSGTLGDMAEGDLESYTSDLLGILQRPAGADPKSHSDDVKALLVNRAKMGDFHTLRVFDEAGGMAQLPVETQLAITSALGAAAPAALAKATKQLAQEIAAIDIRLATDPYADPQELFDAMEEINDRAAGLTGVPRKFGEIFGPDKYPAGMYRNAISQERVDRQVRDAVDKERRAAVLTNDAGTGMLDLWEDPASPFTQGLAMHQLVASGQVKQTELNAQVTALLRELPPAKRAAFLNAFPGDTFEAAKELFSAQWAQTTAESATWEKDGAAWELLHATWAEMTPESRGRYFADSNKRAMLEAYGSAVGASRDRETAFYEKHTILADTRARIGAKPRNETQEAIREYVKDKVVPGFFSQVMGAAAPPEYDLSMLEALLVSEVERADSLNPDPQVRVGQAYGSLQGSGKIDMTGGRLIFNASPKQAMARPLGLEVGLGARDVVYRTLHDLVDKEVRALGGDPKRRTVLRLPDVSGQPIVFNITTYDDEGRELYARVSSADLRTALNARSTSERRIQNTQDMLRRQRLEETQPQ